MRFVIVVEGQPNEVYDDARNADLRKAELTLKGLRPSIIVEDDSIMKNCIFPNHKCGINKCCCFCNIKSCEERCKDDLKTCRMLCTEEEAIDNKLNKKREEILGLFDKKQKSNNQENHIEEPLENSSIKKTIVKDPSKKKLSSLERQERILNVIEGIQAGISPKELASKYGLSTARIFSIKKQYIE